VRIVLLDWASEPEAARQASSATALGRVDSTLNKPTGVRDEEFHTAITEYLAEWAWTTTPVVEAVKIVGDHRSRGVRQIFDVLTRHGVPSGVHPPESEEGRRILDRVTGDVELPVVEVMHRVVLADPTYAELAAAFNLVVDVGSTVYDVAVVGAGPAGLGAAVYGASEGLATLVIEREAVGGQAGTTSMIRNYLGFPRGVSGVQLGRRGLMQATRFGAAFDVSRSVTAIQAGADHHQLTLSNGVVARAGAVLLACGVSYRKLAIPALDALVGAGVFYGAATGAARALTGLPAYVVGAGNSAGQAALHLARHGADVAIVARRSTLRDTMSDYLVHEIDAHGRIAVHTRTEVVDAGGEGHLEWLRLRHNPSGAIQTVSAAGLFLLIGAEPRTAWLPNGMERDARGFVRTGSEITAEGWRFQRRPAALETSVPGVFAAGDVRSGSMKRVAAAAGEGAAAVPMIHSYLERQ
jgi:thioredoxin reductase (NADPH)